MVPAMRGIGYGQMIANASVISYYTCLIALAVYYLVSASANCQVRWVPTYSVVHNKVTGLLSTPA